MYLLFNDAPLLGWAIDMNILILAIAIGVFLAFLAYWFTQTVVGALVRRLLSDSIGEENAKTLDELSKNNFVFRFLLRDGSTLRRIISCVGGELPIREEKADGAAIEADGSAAEATDAKPEADEAKQKEGSEARIIESKEEKKGFFERFKKPKKDFSRAKFYIAEDTVEKASAKYPRKISPYWLILVFFLCAVVGVAMTFLLPYIMGLILD